MRYFLVMCFLLLNCWGCIHEKRTIMPQEMETANAFFLQEDYEYAAEIFSRIYSRAKEVSFRQRALLGLTCSRILLSQNGTQFQEALQLWQTWCKKQTDNLDSENLCMFLTPVFETLSLPEKEKVPDLSSSVANKEKEVKKLRSQVRIKNRKIKELNKKLKALEAIYQEIDQKKRGMNFP